MALGTDIVRISRWEKHAQADGSFLRRAFTAAEIDLCGGRASSLAGRWAAKEALLKALGTGIGVVPLTDIEVGRAEGGRPVLHLHGEALRRASELGVEHWEVSISHDGDYAMAVVIGSK